MMKNIFIHIGIPKTGTTTLQHFFDKKRNFLALNKIFVPEGELRYQHCLPATLNRHYSGFQAPLLVNFNKTHLYYWNLLKQQIESTDFNDIIISSELFCSLILPVSKPKSPQVKSFLQDFFKNYKVYIICYLRDMYSYIKSYYSERVKTGNIHYTISDHIIKAVNRESFHVFPIQILDFYSDVFGQDSLIIKIYDRDKLKNNNIIDDFLSVLNIDCQCKMSFSDFNSSIPDQFINLKRIFNMSNFKDDFKDTQYNIEISNMLCKLNKNLIIPDQYIERINDSINLLNTKYGINFKYVNKNDFDKTFEDTLTPVEQVLILLLSQLIKQNRKILSEVNKLTAI